MATHIRWARREVSRIEALPEADLILEVHNAMNGYTYSWEEIETTLLSLNSDPTVHLSPDWDEICQLRSTWKKFESLTRDRKIEDVLTCLSRTQRKGSWDPTFLRVLLVNMRLVLIRAGVEDERAIHLVHTARKTPVSVSGEHNEEIDYTIVEKSEVMDDERTCLLQEPPSLQPSSTRGRLWTRWGSFQKT